ncbi:unnamed protein product [Thelazia callipaeda]|uniref:Dus domain-containing protein n=1 Tax=Thelazia callipaeda TaxID=103827 RepID=A0A0N5CVC1_THECL|nr:unnamed protein product [Thelazia callipaeda]
MVRYSKLPFRMLVRKYSVDVAFTPMIYAKDFVASDKCRSVEFTTCAGDKPTIAQFAANESEEFAVAAMYCQGVDLNCGCPQRHVMKEGYGSSLLTDPVQIADIVATARRRVTKPNFTVKIYYSENDRKTCRRAESAGASFITVHGRTPEQRSELPNYETIKLIKSTLSIPVIANGNIKSYEQALEVARYTQVDGIMSASGLLENPALFAGYSTTPKCCILDWARGFIFLSVEHGCPFDLFHQQLIFMLRSSLSSSEKIIFNGLSSHSANSLEIISF